MQEGTWLLGLHAGTLSSFLVVGDLVLILGTSIITLSVLVLVTIVWMTWGVLVITVLLIFAVLLMILHHHCNISLLPLINTLITALHLLRDRHVAVGIGVSMLVINIIFLFIFFLLLVHRQVVLFLALVFINKCPLRSLRLHHALGALLLHHKVRIRWVLMKLVLLSVMQLTIRLSVHKSLLDILMILFDLSFTRIARNRSANHRSLNQQHIFCLFLLHPELLDMFALLFEILLSQLLAFPLFLHLLIQQLPLFHVFPILYLLILLYLLLQLFIAQSTFLLLNSLLLDLVFQYHLLCFDFLNLTLKFDFFIFLYTLLI